MNCQSVDLNHQLEVRKLLEAAIKKITYQISLHIIVKMPTKKGPPKTPLTLSKGPPTRKSPRNQKAGERKRGSGLVSRGGKIGKMRGGGRPSLTSSELESDGDDESNGGDDLNEEDECRRGHIGRQTLKPPREKNYYRC